MLARARWEEQDSCREPEIKTDKQLGIGEWAGKHLPSKSASLREDFARLEISCADREAEWASRGVAPGNMPSLDQPPILAPIALLLGNRIAGFLMIHSEPRDPRDRVVGEEFVAHRACGGTGSRAAAGRLPPKPHVMLTQTAGSCRL